MCEHHTWVLPKFIFSSLKKETQKTVEQLYSWVKFKYLELSMLS